MDVVRHLGSPDPELRDDLGIPALVTWIVERPVLEPDQLRRLRDRVVGEDGIRHRLGEAGTDSVLRRSFSMLVVALLLAADNRDPYLGEREWREVVAAVLGYCGAERDLRATVPGHGWAHAVAHAADAVDEAAGSRFAGASTGQELFGALASMLERSTEAFQGEEEDRVAIALSTMLARGLIDAAWLRRSLEAGERSDPARANWKQVVRALYFRIDRKREVDRRELERLQAALTVV